MCQKIMHRICDKLTKKMKVWCRLINCTFGFVRVLLCTSKTVRFYNDDIKKRNSFKKVIGILIKLLTSLNLFID